MLIGCGLAAVEARLRVRYLRADELVEHLYRGLADNSVAKQIDQLLRFDLVLVDEIGFAPLDDTGAQLLFRFVAAAYERRSLGVASHWPFEQWGASCPSTQPPSRCSTGCSTTPPSSSPAASRSA